MLTTVRQYTLVVFLLLTMRISTGSVTIPPGVLSVKGSFLIAAICKDGIVLASDSRGNIFDRSDRDETPIAYFDANQKIFPVGRHAIADTGQGLILNVFFSAIVRSSARATQTFRWIDSYQPSFSIATKHYLQRL